ncbi:MAG: hypothetical protein WD468_04305 [Pirellulales bacterium]
MAIIYLSSILVSGDFGRVILGFLTVGCRAAVVVNWPVWVFVGKVKGREHLLSGDPGFNF